LSRSFICKQAVALEPDAKAWIPSPSIVVPSEMLPHWVPRLTAGRGSIRSVAPEGPFQLGLVFGAKGVKRITGGLFLDGRRGAFVSKSRRDDLRIGHYRPGDAIEIVVRPDGIEYFVGGELVHRTADAVRYPVDVGVCATGPTEMETRLQFSDGWREGAPAEGTEDETVALVIAVAGDKRVGETLGFDASSTRDITKRVERYAWQFGDGTSDEGIKVEHAYVAPGSYVVTLTVSGPRLERVERTETVVVRD
jgi:hypothetical protein